MIGEADVTTVRLEPWELDWIRHVGLRRHEANLEKRDAAYYDPARMEDNLTASIAACASELAVAKATNRYWDGSYWTADQHRRHRGRADVGRNIEVRRIRRPGNPLVVRRRDVEAERVVFCAHPIPPGFEVVEVRGWLEASVAWTVGRPADYDRQGTTRLVDQQHLRTL